MQIYKKSHKYASNIQLKMHKYTKDGADISPRHRLLLHLQRFCSVENSVEVVVVLRKDAFDSLGSICITESIPSDRIKLRQLRLCNLTHLRVVLSLLSPHYRAIEPDSVEVGGNKVAGLFRNALDRVP